MTPLAPGLLDRLPPQSLEAEQAVLCSILLDPRRADDVADILRPGDFRADANQRLYGHLQTMWRDNREISTLLLVERLKQQGDFEAIGGMAYLVEVARAEAVAAHAVYHAEIVREKARRRKMIDASYGLLRDAWDETLDVPAVLDAAEKRLAEIQTHGQAMALIDAPAAAQQVLDYADTMIANREQCGILTGLLCLDNATGGLLRGEYTILAARPGRGKTALAAGIAYHNAERGRLVYIASLEMDAREYTQRIVCGLGGVDSRKIRTGTLNAQDRGNLVEGAAQFARGRVRLDPRTRLTVSEIHRTCRRLLKDDLALVVIDYLQLLQPEDTKVIREQQVAGMSLAMKNMARELKVPVLCLAQLSRAAEDQVRPALRTLRESGSLEQDADMVLMIHRPSSGIVDDEWQEPVKVGGRRMKQQVKREWPAELLLLKNRHGEEATFRLNWHQAATRFDDWDTAVHAPNREPAFDSGGDPREY